MNAEVFAANKNILAANSGYRAFTRSTLTAEDKTLHCHDYWQISLQSEKKLLYGIGNDVFALDRNVIQVIPPFTMHGVVGDPDVSPFRWWAANLEPYFLEQISVKPFAFESILRNHLKKGSYCFSLSEENMRLCSFLLTSIHENVNDRSNLGLLNDISKLLPVIHVILESEPVQPLSFSELPNRTMYRVLQYVDAHFTESLTLKDLAEQFGISVSTLSHTFSKYTGRSLYDYILYRRVMLAAQQLGEDIPLNEISSSCGFNDYSNFLRSFHKIHGMAPRDYQKTLRRYAG